METEMETVMVMVMETEMEMETLTALIPPNADPKDVDAHRVNPPPGPD